MSRSRFLEEARKRLVKAQGKVAKAQAEVELLEKESGPITTVKTQSARFMVIDGRLWTLETPKRGSGFTVHFRGKSIGNLQPACAMHYLPGLSQVLASHCPEGHAPAVDYFYTLEGAVSRCIVSLTDKEGALAFVYGQTRLAVVRGTSLYITDLECESAHADAVVPFPDMSPEHACRDSCGTVVVAAGRTVHFLEMGGDEEGYLLSDTQELDSRVLQLSAGAGGRVHALCESGIYELGHAIPPRFVRERGNCQGIYVCPHTGRLYIGQSVFPCSRNMQHPPVLLSCDRAGALITYNFDRPLVAGVAMINRLRNSPYYRRLSIQYMDSSSVCFSLEGWASLVILSSNVATLQTNEPASEEIQTELRDLLSYL